MLARATGRAARLADLGVWVRERMGHLNTAERCVLVGVALLHGLAIGWGLPSSDAWDVDGIAPRDFLPGVVQTFTPGDHFTYPPLHLLLLTLLTLPVTAVQLLRAHSLAPADVVTAFLSVPVMTTFSLVARVVSLLMSLGVVLVIGRIATVVFATPKARVWAMATGGVEVAGTYYAHTSNLDLPALFWSSLALLALVDALEKDEPRRLRRVAVLIACAIATKDQAYAVFALTMPIALGAWLVVRTGARRELAREVVLCAVIGIGLTLVVDGAIFNPSGFAARVRFLVGPASQDYAQHSRDVAGRLSVIEDAALYFPNHYPVLLAPVFVAGLVVAFRINEGRRRITALIPLLVLVSFTLAFDCVARRVEERFLMPQMQLIAVYAGVIGVVVERFIATRRATFAHAVRGFAVLALALGARLSATVIATMYGDARYDAERFVRDNVRAGEVIEVYGDNVYLPRFPEGLVVERIDPRPVKGRNPMPGIVERQGLLGAIGERRPRWVVVGMGFAWRYLQADLPATKDGRVLPRTQQLNLADADKRDYFRALFAEQAGYVRVHLSTCATSWLLPAHPLHASIATDVVVFERR